MIAKFKWKRTLRQLSIVATLAMLYSTPCQAAIIDVLNTTSGVSTVAGVKTITVPFDAGAIADKLVVQVSSERSGGTPVITYDGVPLIQAASQTGRFSGIWYLDNPYSGGSAPLTIDMTGVTVVNGISVGAVSLTGSAPGSTDADSVGGTSVTVNIADANSFVLAGYGANGTGGVVVDAQLTPVYNFNNIGNARGAAGFQNGVVVGSETYTFSGGGTPATGAAVFAPSGLRQSISGLFTTGVDGTGTSLPSLNAGDPHYTLVEVPSGSSSIIVGRDPDIPGAWNNNLSTSAWIGPANSSTTLTGPQGNYTAETSFMLPANADLSSVLVSGTWAVDNGKVDILVNGNSLDLAGFLDAGDLNGNFGSFEAFSIPSGVPFWQPGVNTLGFRWRNASPSNNPTGLRIGSINGSYSIAVPEPGTYAVFGVLLAAVLLVGRRRRRNSGNMI